MSRSRSRSPLRRSNGSDANAGHRRDRGGDRGGGRNRIDHRSDRMVYLSNLPWELKWMELKDIIREKAGEVNFVEVLEERDGRSKGCAVVEFKHRDDAVKCIENMHKTELRDRLIIAKEIRDPVAFFRKVKDDTGIDFLGGGDRPDRSRGLLENTGGVKINENETYGLSPNFLRQLGISTPLGNRVFITNIPYNCGVGRLFDVSALAGKVTWLDLQLDKEGKSKGMAVVEYSHPIEAVQAVSMLNSQRLLDRTLAVRMDRYQKEIERREPGGLPFGLRGVGMGLGANGAPLTDVASVISSINPLTHLNASSVNGNIATVTPLAATAFLPIATPTQQTVWPSAANPTVPVPMMQSQPLMQQTPAQTGGYQPTPTAPILQSDHGTGGGHFQSPYQQTHTPHATGGFFNAPATQSTVRQTPGMQQYGSGGGQQYVPKSTPSYVPAPQSTPSQQTPVKYEAYDSGYGTGQTNRNASSGVGASHIGGAGTGGGGGGGGIGHYEATRIILIKNLPVDYTWQIVSDRVQQFGDLESVEMITPGVAKVRFMLLKDAERAKNALQGTTVEGRAIGIEYL